MSRDIIINTGGTYLNIAFATFYTIFLARVFDRVEFGVLSVLLVFSYVLANILSFGMPASIYAHLPDLARDSRKSIQFLKSNILLLALLASISLLIIFSISPIIDKHFFKLDAPPVYYALALTGTLLYVIQNFIRDALNAVGDFLHINIAQNISNVVKTSLLVALAVTSKITIGNALFVMGIIGPAVVFLVVLFERKWIVKTFIHSPVARSAIKLGYTLQYFISTQLFSIATRVDLFLVAYFLMPGDKGDYALSQRIVVAIVTTTDSITQVLSPQFAKAKSGKDVLSLLRKSFMYMLIPASIFLAASITPSSIYELFFTDKFVMSVSITRLLSIAYIPYGFAAVLALFFLYTVKRPVHVLISNALLLTILFLGNYTLIPQLGLFGPPVAALGGFITVLIYLTVFFTRHYNLDKKV